MNRSFLSVSGRVLSAVLLGMLVLWAAPAVAGGYTQFWGRGSIILTSGDTIDGPVTYYHDQETLEVRMADGTARTFPAVNVSYFIVSHERPQQLGYRGGVSPYTGSYRNGMYPASWRTSVTDTFGVKLFVTYYWNQETDYSDFRTPGFFQQLTDGNIRLMRREQLVERMVTPSDPYYRYSGYPMGGGYYTEVRDAYYLADPQGKITTLRNVKRDLLAYFGKYSDQIHDYAKKNKLSYSDGRELVLILRYADALASGGNARQE